MGYREASDAFPNLNLALIRLALSLAESTETTKFPNTGKVIYKNSIARIYFPVFYVYKESNSLFIVVRGSIDPADFQTDADYRPYENNDGKFHKGFYLSAKGIYDKVKPIIEEVMKRDTENVMNYYFVGHSLGGSVSTIMTYLFMSDYQSSSVGCIAFGPAPCMNLHKSIASELENHIITIVHDIDIVPTLSIRNMHQILVPLFPEPGKYIDELALINSAESALNSLKTSGTATGDNLHYYLSEKVKEIVKDIIAFHEMPVESQNKYVNFVCGNVFVIKKNSPKTLKDASVSAEKVLCYVHVTRTSVRHHALTRYREAIEAIPSLE